MRLTPVTSIVYTALAVGLLFSSMFDVHTVSGDSMSPVLSENDKVFVFRWAYGLQPPFIHRYIVEWGNIREGDILVLREPEFNTRVIKRCERVSSATDTVFVLGDNGAKSRDSRHYGAVAAHRIEGKVVTLP
jgi:signal peptidase I